MHFCLSWKEEHKLQGFPPSILLNTLLRVLPANESYIFLVLLILPTQKQFKNY